MNKISAVVIDGLSFGKNNISLKKVESKGVGLFVTKNFKKNDTIFTEPIFIHKNTDDSIIKCLELGYRSKKYNLVKKYCDINYYNVAEVMVVLNDHLNKGLELPQWVHTLAIFDHDEWVTIDEKSLINKITPEGKYEYALDLFNKMKTNNFALHRPTAYGNDPLIAFFFGKKTSRINTSITKDGNNCLPNIDVFLNGKWTYEPSDAIIENGVIYGVKKYQFRLRVIALGDIASGDELLTSYPASYVEKIKEAIKIKSAKNKPEKNKCEEDEVTLIKKRKKI